MFLLLIAEFSANCTFSIARLKKIVSSFWFLFMAKCYQTLSSPPVPVSKTDKSSFSPRSHSLERCRSFSKPKCLNPPDPTDRPETNLAGNISRKDGSASSDPDKNRYGRGPQPIPQNTKPSVDSLHTAMKVPPCRRFTLFFRTKQATIFFNCFVSPSKGARGRDTPNFKSAVACRDCFKEKFIRYRNHSYYVPFHFFYENRVKNNRKNRIFQNKTSKIEKNGTYPRTIFLHREKPKTARSFPGTEPAQNGPS